MPSRLVTSSRRTVRTLRLLLIASTIVPVVLFALAAWKNRYDVLREAGIEIRQSADVLHEHAAKVIETDSLVLKQVNLRIRGLDEAAMRGAEIHDFLKDMAHGIDQIDTLWIVGADGEVLNSSRYFPPPRLNVADRDYFKALRTEDVGTYISAFYSGRLTKRPQFNIVSRITSADGGFAGLVSVSENPDYFVDFYRSLRSGKDHAINLVREDGEILARFPDLVGEHRRFNPDGPMMRAITSGQEGFAVATSEFDGVERLFAHKKLKGYPIYVSFGESKSAVLQGWYGDMAVYGLFTAPLALALVAMAWVGLRRARQEEAAALRLEKEMQRREAAEEKLRQAQKMEAVGQLTGGVAHDFNNLLTVIIGNLDLVEQAAGQLQLGRHTDAIRRAAERGERLTRQLLAFSRKQTLRPRPVDLRIHAHEAIDMLRTVMYDHISIDAALAEELWTIEIDANELDLALLNIANNAADAMPHGGVLRIEARNVRLPDSQFNAPDLTGDFVALTVSDTGQGIAPEDLSRVFEPFFTTKDIGKGTGLGLSQVYGFAQQSGGAAEIRSELGRGTAVTLYFPRAPGIMSPGIMSPGDLRDEDGPPAAAS